MNVQHKPTKPENYQTKCSKILKSRAPRNAYERGKSHGKSKRSNERENKILFKQTFVLLSMASSFIDGIFYEEAGTKREAISLFPLDCSEVNSAW